VHSAKGPSTSRQMAARTLRAFGLPSPDGGSRPDGNPSCQKARKHDQRTHDPSAGEMRPVQLLRAAWFMITIFGLQSRLETAGP
jgi:hypothetical protein